MLLQSKVLFIQMFKQPVQSLTGQNAVEVDKEEPEKKPEEDDEGNISFHLAPVV